MTDNLLERLKAEGCGLVRMEIHHPDGTRMCDVTAPLTADDIGPHLQAQIVDPMVEAIIETVHRKWLHPADEESAG
ncbi:Uncharacterised protein [Mycobacteroides abscessus subsp. abscessus]|nr:Uncharacterised protein [Mycobacteroides abscessus subsp. abscessus]